MAASLADEDRRLAEHLLHHAPHYRELIEQLLEEATASRSGGKHASLKQLLVQRRVLSAGDLVLLLQQVRAGADPADCDPPYSLVETRPQSAAAEQGASELHHDFHLYGRYRATEEVARGGMGIVYRAVDEKTGQTVALKVLKSGDQATGDEIDRFQREVQASRALDHPGIVKLLGHGEDRGRYFYAMEYVEGTSLDALHLEPGFTPMRAAQLLVAVARALEAAHAQQIIHRDLKPANILIDSEGRPRLTDFGLAKILSGSVLTLTASGMTLGTPFYMAPEQVDDKGTVDERTDVYALGVVLYQCLTRKLPFVGSHANLFYKILETAPEPPRKLLPELDLDLETICLKAMSKDKVHRYQTMGELADDLERYLAGKTIAARRSSLLMRIGQQAHRQRKALLGAIAAVLLLSPLVGWLIHRQRRAAAEARELADSQRKLRRDRLTASLQELLTRARAEKEPQLALATLDKALPIYRELGLPPPGPILGLRALWQARIAREQRQLTRARALLGQAIASDPESYQAHRELAAVLLALGERALAQQAYQKGQALAAGLAGRLTTRAEQAVRAGRLPAALALVSRAIELLGSRVAARHYELRGRIYLAHGLADRALSDFERAQTAGGDPATVATAQAAALRRLGRLDEARRRLVASGSKAPAAQKMLAQVCFLLGRHEEALAASERAAWLTGRFRALVQLERYGLAEAIGAQLWQTGRVTAQARYFKGRLLEARKLTAAARQLYLAAASDPTWRADAELALARLALRAGQPEPALARLSALRAGGARRDTLLAEAQLALRRYREAVDSATRAIERYPYDAIPFQLRGRALARLGEDRAAHRDFVQAYGLDNLNFRVFELVLRNLIDAGRMEMLPRLNEILQRFRFDPDPYELERLLGRQWRRLLATRATQARSDGEAAGQRPDATSLGRSLERLTSSDDELERSLARATLLSGGAVARQLVARAVDRGEKKLAPLLQALDRRLARQRRAEVEKLLSRWAAGRYAPAGRQLLGQVAGYRPILRDILRDRNADVLLRIWAGRALAWSRTPEALGWLRGVARGPDSESGLIVGWVLRGMRIAAHLPSRAALASQNPSLLTLALLALPRPDARLARPHLTHAAPRVRYAAAVTLLRDGDRSALAVLEKLQAHADPLLRRLGILGLAARGGHDGWPLLPFYERALSDRDPVARALGARLIHHLGDGRAAELLFAALKTESQPLVMGQMLFGLIKANTPESKRFAVALLDDTKRPLLVRVSALYTMIRWLRDRQMDAMPNWKRLVTEEPDPILRCASLYGLFEYLPVLAIHYLRANLEAKQPAIRGLVCMGMLLMPSLREADKRALIAIATTDRAPVARRTAWVTAAVLAHAGRLKRPGIWREIAGFDARDRHAVAEGLVRLPEMDKVRPPQGQRLAAFHASAARRAVGLWPEQARYRAILADHLLDDGQRDAAAQALAPLLTRRDLAPESLRALARLARAREDWAAAAARENQAVAAWLKNPFPVTRGIHKLFEPHAALIRAAADLARVPGGEGRERLLERACWFQSKDHLRTDTFLLLARARAEKKDASGVARALSELMALGGRPGRIRGELGRRVYAGLRDREEMKALQAALR